MSSTVNCVTCFEKAKGFGGHVHKKRNKIIAGFCDKHFNSEHFKRKTPSAINGCKGCYGDWVSKMGLDY